MKLEIKTLKDIYLYLELELIQAERIPNLTLEYLNSHQKAYQLDENKSLFELISLHNPSLDEIENLILDAFNIPKLNSYEKLLIIIDWFEKNKLSKTKSYELILNFDPEYKRTLNNYDIFQTDFYNYIILNTLVYGGDWDEDFLEIKNECQSKITNFDYIEYLT